MSDDKKNKGLLKSLSELSFVKKLKSIKHIEIIIVIIFVLILLLICFGDDNTFGFLNSSKNSDNQTDISTSEMYYSTIKYVDDMESKLKNLLSKIENAGDVEVMISVDGSGEILFATDEIITTSGQMTEKEIKTIFVEIDGKERPIIIYEKMPNINGIVVVSSGAKNTKVKLDIISAVQTLIDIDLCKIEVIVGK